MKFAVIKAGGKQYVVSENDEIVVDNLNQDVDATVEFERLAEGDFDAQTITLGNPTLKNPVKATLLANEKGDKLRVARYKAKTRYRNVTGFRPMLSRVKIAAL